MTQTAVRLNQMIENANRLASFWYCPDHPERAEVGCQSCSDIAEDLKCEREEQYRQEARLGTL